MLDALQKFALSFLNTTLYGNSIQQWLSALALVILSIILGVLFLRTVGRGVKFLVRKTDTSLDDIFVDSFEEPLTVLLVAFGIQFSLESTLNMSELVTFRLENIFEYLVPAIVFVWFVTRFYEAVHYYYHLSIKYLLWSRFFFLVAVFAITLFIIINWVIQPRNCYFDCVGANLVARNLRGDDLHGANFIEAILRDSDLGGANLRRADFSGANLIGVNLSNADLSQATFIGADLSGADLRGAILKSADLSGATLNGADLTHTDLTETRLRGVIFDNAQLIEVDMHGADLIGGSFSRANLSGSNLSQVDLSGAILSGTDLSGAFLENTDLSGASMNLANLNGANLHQANLSGASLIGSNIAAANLSNSQLIGSILIGADLSGANLNSANLTDARMFIAELDERDILFDPVLLELNELQREEVIKDINLRGVKFNTNTKWPEAKQVLLSGILGRLFIAAGLDENSALITMSDPIEVDGIKLNPVIPAQVQGDIFTAGSGTVAFLTQPMSTFFLEQGYRGDIKIENSGTDSGFKRLCEEGVADIVNASRLILPTETQICMDHGHQPIPFQFGLDSIVVAVNPTNTFLTDVTKEELAAIFTARQWSDVNPNWPARDIVHVMPDSISGMFDSFVDLVFEGDAASLSNAPNTQISAKPSDQIWAIVNNPDAIGFLSQAYYQQNADLVKALTIDGVEATLETVTTGQYPLTRPLLMYSTADIIQQKPQVGAFINFFLTHVNALIDPLGYFPVDTNIMDASKTTLIDVTK